MRRTGAQECNNFLKPKATNNSLIRLTMEPNLCSYETNSSLSSTMRIKRDTLDLGEVEAPVPCGCFLGFHRNSLEPAPPTAQNQEKVVHSQKSSQDAPRACAARPKPREGRRFRGEFSGCSTRQRRRPPQTTRGLSISHGATARALRHARNVQKVSEATLKFAQHHDESASTRTKPAAGSQTKFKIRTAPQREPSTRTKPAEGCIPPTPTKPMSDVGAVVRR